MTFKRDEQLIEDEIENGPRGDRPRTLATHYLSEAITALHQAGDPAYLYRKFLPDDIKPKPFGWEWIQRWGREERFTQSVNCVLFCAFSAEAFVNEFLASFTPSKSQFSRLENMSTTFKYTEGIKEVFGEPLFWKGDEVMPTMTKLFKLRNDLAHPKPGTGPPGLMGEPDPELDARLALPELGEYLVAVAGAGDVLTWRSYGYERFDYWARSVWRARETVRDFARRAAELPAPDAAAQQPLWQQIQDHLDKMKPIGDHPQATWTRVRKANAQREAEGSDS